MTKAILIAVLGALINVWATVAHADEAYDNCAEIAADEPGDFYEPFVACLESIGWDNDEARLEADTILCPLENVSCELAIICE